MFLDAHIHLQDLKEDVTRSLLSGAADKGVGRFFCNAASPDDWQTVKEMADRDKRIVPFFGVHPWHAEKVEEGYEEDLRGFCSANGGGVGEIGLDKIHNGAFFDRQTEIFVRQLDIACSLRKPFAVHCVRAWDVLIEALRSRDLKGSRFMIHAFSGTQEDLRALAGMGAYFSFRILKNVSENKRRIFTLVPIDRLFLETDFPYLATGEKDPGQELYFSYLRELYEAAAEMRGMEVGRLKEVIWNNGTVFMY
ncbi:MAG: TatD family hydrolase [Candidatus Omnitrophica bacterium]|nr:TatD family hydrolase [Candidatus Omnitrophota bacterium]